MAELEMNFCSFKASINAKEAISWSNDNRIAMLSDEGVFVMEFSWSSHVSSENFILNKLLIPANKEVYNLSEKYVRKQFSNHLSIAAKKERDGASFSHTFTITVSLPEDYNKLRIDRTLCPDNQDPSLRGYRSIQWSPKGGDEIGRCILACLTMDHRLSIFRELPNKKEWEKVIELSSIYYNKESRSQRIQSVMESCASLKSEKSSESIWSCLKKMVYSLAAVEMAWSCSYNDENFLSSKHYAVLAVGMKNGDVVLWKALFPAVSQSDFHFVRTLSIYDNLPTALVWYPNNKYGLLAIGYMDGVIKLLNFNKNDFSLEESVNIFSDQDFISVSGLTWNLEKCILYAAKGVYIMAFLFDAESRSFQSQTYIQGNHTLYSTGFTCCCNHLLLASSDGILQLVKTDIENNAPVLTSQVLPVKLVDIKWPWQYHGAALSPNSLLMAVLLSPSSGYDHLKLRNPVKLGICQLKEYGNSLNLLEFKPYHGTGIFDLLLLYQQKLASGGSLPQTVIETLQHVNTWTSLPLHILKVIRYLMLNPHICIDGKEENDNGENNEKNRSRLEINASKLLELQDFILLFHLQSFLERVIEEEKILNDRELLVLTAIDKWLQYKKKTVQQWSRFQSLADQLSSFLKSRNTTGRCCKSFLACQEIPYRKCSICGSLALSLTAMEEFPWLMGNKHNCTLCDGNLWGAPIGPK